MAMKIRSLKLRDERYGNQWAEQVENRWDYDDFLANERWRRGWISFDCALYEPSDDRVYLGVSSFEADIFRAYDRRRDVFLDLGYAKIADPFDGKFHRSLERGNDGCLYGAIALFHCVDRFRDAPGGAIVKYDPRSGELTKLTIPLPHTYIQAIVIDHERDLIHGLCFAPEKLITLNLRSGEVIDHGLIGTGYGGMCQGENICLDDAGGCWSNWQLTRAWQRQPGPDGHRLCKIDPEQNRIVFFQRGLPRPEGGHGTTRVEAFFNLGDGSLYASGGNGSLFRIDPATAESEYLFTPIPDRPSRLTSLVVGRDGCAYGIIGRDGRCELLRFDFRDSRYELIGNIKDADGEAMWQCHHIVLADDGTLYACENDNPHRSSYLWEIAGVFDA